LNPLCPNCQTELTDDFGLVDCKSCGAVCSIDLEGNATVQGDELEQVPEEEVFEEAVETEVVVEEELVAYDAPEEIAESPVENEIFEEPVVVAAATAANALSGEDFLRELEVFAEEAASDEGHIYYDFHVAGLESRSIKESFIETLADSRLEISEESVREILGESNEFTLMQVSLLRLTVIHKRLLTLDLDMSWSLSEVQEPISYMMEESLEDGEGFDEESINIDYDGADEGY